MQQRNDLYALATALATPKTPYEIILALNAPDSLSPYKRQMTDMIMAGVSLEIFMEEMYVIYEIEKAHEQERRENILQGLKDEKAAELLIYRQSLDYAMKRPERLLERRDNLSELQLKAQTLQSVLKVERANLPVYEKEIARNEGILAGIEKEWGKQQGARADSFINEFDKKDEKGDKKYDVTLSTETKDRLKAAFIMADPSKLLEINRQVIREAGDDKEKINQCANTMAQKGGFVRQLKTLEIIGGDDVRMTGEKSVERNNVIIEHVLSPKKIRELGGRLPDMPSVEPEKDILVTAITADNERAELQNKVEKVYTMEKTYNTLTDKIRVLENQPNPNADSDPSQGMNP